MLCCWQALSQGMGGTAADQIGLDVHAISDLQGRGVPTTDDSAKYKYQATEDGKYCKSVSKGVVLLVEGPLVDKSENYHLKQDCFHITVYSLLFLWDQISRSLWVILSDKFVS